MDPLKALVAAVSLVGFIIFIIILILVFAAIIDKWLNEYKNEKNINEITKRRN